MNSTIRDDEASSSRPGSSSAGPTELAPAAAREHAGPPRTVGRSPSRRPSPAPSPPRCPLPSPATFRSASADWLLRERAPGPSGRAYLRVLRVLALAVEVAQEVGSSSGPSTGGRGAADEVPASPCVAGPRGSSGRPRTATRITRSRNSAHPRVGTRPGHAYPETVEGAQIYTALRLLLFAASSGSWSGCGSLFTDRCRSSGRW